MSILPVGLCEVFSTIARVRSPNAARSSASSIDQSGSCNRTNRGVAPDSTVSGQ